MLGDRKLSHLVSAHPSVFILGAKNGAAIVGLRPGWGEILGKLTPSSAARIEVTKLSLVQACMFIAKSWLWVLGRWIWTVGAE